MNGLTVAIQAGGKSSRMGTDKAFVPFQGRPMIEVVLERVAGLGDELILITNKPDDYAHLGRPMFGDVYPDSGPLGGIYTAVYHAAHPHTLVVACDMPWLNRPLLEYMAGLRESADIIVPRWDKFPEPLHAIYNKACIGPDGGKAPGATVEDHRLLWPGERPVCRSRRNRALRPRRPLLRQCQHAGRTG
jgi:molybdenum cofactor guanylyltransferase